MSAQPEAAADPARRRYAGGVVPWLGIAIPGWLTYRVWQRNRDVFFRLWKAELLPPTLEPIITLFGLGLGLGGYVTLGGELDYVQFLVPGMLMVFPMFGAMFEALFGSYFRKDQHGTYAAIHATPVRPEEIVLGDVTWAASRMAGNTALIIIVFAILTPWMDLIQSPLVLLTIPISFVTGLVIAGVAIAFTSIARALSQLSYFFSLYVLPMFWFSGGFFPTDDLPGWAQTLSAAFPLYHAVAASRGLVTGDLHASMLGHLAWLLIATLPALWLGIWAMRRRIVRG
ncbi:MAG: ABC transporter permease [Dehalococcoidia bacterium]